MKEVLVLTSKQMLIKEIETLPPQIVEEVYDFVNFLKIKITQMSNINDIHLASENVLARDWQLPEEDEAWASL